MATAVEGSASDEYEKKRSNSDVNVNVKFELEKLNAATDGINHLETEYEEAKALMEKMVNEALTLLAKSANKIGRSTIEKANEYFESNEKLLKAKDEFREAEIRYEDSERQVLVAKERVKEVERTALACGNGILHPSVQEDINQANIEFSKAINRRNEYAEKKDDCFGTLMAIETQRENVKKKAEKSIKKARSYFDLKETLYYGLEQQRERVEKIGEGICFAKEQYSEVLGNLENISEEIHRKRRNRASSKSGPKNENFRRSMNEASLNETEQRRMTDYINNPDRNNLDDTDYDDNGINEES